MAHSLMSIGMKFFFLNWPHSNSLEAISYMYAIFLNFGAYVIPGPYYPYSQ